MQLMDSSTPSRLVLARNLNRLMDTTWSLNSNTKLVKRSGLGLGTMGRVRNAEAAATIDTLDKLAESFGVQPWQLLAPEHAMQSQQAALPMAESQPVDAAPLAEPAPQPSRTARELAMLFDLLTGRDGKVDQAEVFTAALEAISRTVTGRHTQPTDAPTPPVQVKKPVA